VKANGGDVPMYQNSNLFELGGAGAADVEAEPEATALVEADEAGASAFVEADLGAGAAGTYLSNGASFSAPSNSGCKLRSVTATSLTVSQPRLLL
jgi:hypothetical protein